MINDYIPIAHAIEGNADVHIYPCADVHLGAYECLEAQFDDWIQVILSDPRGYAILAGDLMNNTTRTSVSNVFDERIRPREQKRILAEKLAPLKEANRILCAVPGNHEQRSGKDADDDPIYDIMCKLDLEDLYRENVAYMKVHIGKFRTDGEKNPTYTFAVTHGAGGGALTGAAVNRNERFGYTLDGVDALVVGHNHKPFVTAPCKIKFDARNNQVKIAPFANVGLSSWLSYGGYAARKMLLPAGNVPQIITLHGDRKAIEVNTIIEY